MHPDSQMMGMFVFFSICDNFNITQIGSVMNTHEANCGGNIVYSLYVLTHLIVTS